uniref:Uncharacterized protein n=1 Tax=Apis cerana TaxID=7461 RepID=V9I8U9_APICE
MTITTDSCWPRGLEMQSSIEASPVSEKPTPPTSSPPRSPDQIEGDSSRGAVPRRSGSCSSSSSSLLLFLFLFLLLFFFLLLVRQILGSTYLTTKLIQ